MLINCFIIIESFLLYSHVNISLGEMCQGHRKCEALNISWCRSIWDCYGLHPKTRVGFIMKMYDILTGRIAFTLWLTRRVFLAGWQMLCVIIYCKISIFWVYALQLLFESSEEKGNGKKYITSILLWLLVQMCIYFLILKIKAFAVEGLGLISGVVRKFESSEVVKVPHISWNWLNIKRPSKLLNEVHGQHLYFVHSYRAVPVRSV